MADYQTGIPIASDAPIDNTGTYNGDDEQFLDVGRLRRQYYDYLGVKMAEIEEQKEARRYYHGAQWSDREIRALKKRRQPVITSNRIGRKIDAVVGLTERLRQEPRAYPRQPQGEDGADVATAVLRYCLDHVDWKSKSPRVSRYAAIDGICGVELDIEIGDHGDPDIDLHLVYGDTFFYDPRSFDDGFTDCRFLGVSKWIDADQAKEMFPDKADEIDGLVEMGTDLTPNSDREITWINTSAKKVRLIDHWYINRGKWYWCLYIGNAVMMEGLSPYLDERNKTFPKFIMVACNVDHDGDRYGFVRNLKGPQDEINHRRSKGLHILNSRKLIADKGAVDDVEKARHEWARPDGFVEKNPGKEITPENQQADFAGQLSLLQEAKTEIENFGPNPALIGQGIENSSGRAINLLQQAGVAELGPFIVSYRTWKIRVYRAIWNIVQRYWTAERWIRVTDDEGLAQFVKVNGIGLDQYGHPAIVNAVGSLDVDIILDEGPDNINMMADAYDTLVALAQAGQKIPPDVLIELAPLQNSVKQRLLQKLEQAMQPDPMAQQAKVVALQGEIDKNQNTRARTALDTAKAAKEMVGAHLDLRQQRQLEQQTQPLPDFNAALNAPPPSAVPSGGVPQLPSPQQLSMNLAPTMPTGPGAPVQPGLGR